MIPIIVGKVDALSTELNHKLIQVSMGSAEVITHTYIHTYTYIYTHTYTHIYTHTLNTHIHTYTHTYIYCIYIFDIDKIKN